MSIKPAKTGKRMPFPRSQRTKNEKAFYAGMGKGTTKDTWWAQKYGVPRRRKFQGDVFTVAHRFPLSKDEADDLKKRYQKYGPYKYRTVQTPEGYWVYCRLAHKKAGDGNRRY